MKITTRKRKTVRQRRDEIQEKYGSLRKLQAHVRKNPRDTMAKVALHDLREYKDDRPAKVIHETQEIIIPDESIDRLTIQRLQVLLALKGLGSAPSARALARAVNRDIKNVSEDIHALRELGLLNVASSGPGRPHKISLAGDEIDLHLVGPAA